MTLYCLPIDVAFSIMEELCVDAGNAQLTQALQEYKKQYSPLKENITQVASLYLAGDKESAAGVNAQMREIVLAMQEKQAIFAETLSDTAQVLADSRISEASILFTASMIISIIFIVVAILMTTHSLCKFQYVLRPLCNLIKRYRNFFHAC